MTDIFDRAAANLSAGGEESGDDIIPYQLGAEEGGRAHPVLVPGARVAFALYSQPATVDAAAWAKAIDAAQESDDDSHEPIPEATTLRTRDWGYKELGAGQAVGGAAESELLGRLAGEGMEVVGLAFCTVEGP